MKMKTVLAASAAVVALAAFSTAAEAQPFTGTYLGADIGYGSGDANSERFGVIGGPLVSTQADAEIDGFLLGAHLGHNWHLGPQWILGVEGEWRYAGLEGDDGGSGGDINELSTNWDASLTAHLGLVVSPSAMIYLTGGFTWLDADSNVLNAPIETVSETFGGWTLGGGIEFSLGAMTTARVQYRYADYDEEVLTFPINLYDMETGPTINEITAGVSWYF